MIDLSDAAPLNPDHGSGDLVDPLEPAILLDPVIFLFKFEDIYSHTVSYDWIVSVTHLISVHNIIIIIL